MGGTGFAYAVEGAVTKRITTPYETTLVVDIPMDPQRALDRPRDRGGRRRCLAGFTAGGREYPPVPPPSHGR